MQNGLKQGEALFAEGKIEEAEKCFLEILNEDPKNKEAYNNLGVISFQRQNIEQACARFMKALEIDPFYKYAVLNYSETLRALNPLHEAIPFLKNIIPKYPMDKELNNLLEEAVNIVNGTEKNSQIYIPQPKSKNKEQLFPGNLFKNGDTVFDVGAHIGEKTGVFLAHGAKVICFEPQPDCVKVLRERYGRNTNVVIVEKGLADATGEMELSICSQANTISTFSDQWKKGRFSDYQWDKSISVEVTTLDNAVETYGLPQYVKIDAEGFEYQILCGLSRPIPYISFEFTIEFLDNAKRCVSLLEDLGYNYFNFAIGESSRLVLVEWVSSGMLFEKTEGVDDKLLWGDIYAKFEQHERSHEPATAEKATQTLAFESSKAITIKSAMADSDVNPLERLRSAGLWRDGQPLRLHLGCGEQHFEGYVNIDYPPSEHNVMSAKADIFADVMKLHFPAESVDEIRLHHVFEHFSRVTALAMLIKWHKWLKIGGKLHIETPDLIGSAKTLVSNTSWKTKMGVVRHLAGDQAASWAYHIDHWFPERFEHTLRKLGFDPVKTRSLSWQHEPYLSNVEAIAIKARYVSIEKQLRNADELLWESTVAPAEKTTYGVWSKQLRAVIGNTLVSAPGNTETPDVSEILQAPAVLSQFASQLPLSEIHGFNQNDRNAWVRAKAASVPNGAHVLDIGAGTCPYRDLFAHCDYKTHDFEKYRGVKLGGAIEYGEIDYVSDILNIPVEDNSFDVILCTEVLEHVPEPIEALREMARILRPGGRIFLTAPLGSGLHQLPYHYYGGYTPEWYKHFFPKFGLNVKEITPNGGFFKLLAQECVRVVSTLPEHRHLHGNNVEFIRALFGELIPRYLFALEERHFIDQFTVGYHVEAMKNADTVITDNPKFDRDTNIEKGEAAFNKGDFEEAEKYFLEALKTDSKKKEAYNNLGVIAFQKKNIRESIDYFTKALEIDPFYKDAIINYSVLLKSLDRFHESIPILEKAVDKFPHDKELSHLLNEVRLTQKSQTKIAVLCLPGLQSFLGDIVDYLKTKYDVRTCYSNNNQEIESAVRWADVVWLEWANELTVAITNHPTMLDSKRVICRLHSYEALAGYARKINWERIADLIFVAKHIKDIVLQQVPSLPNRVKKIHIVPNGVNLDKFIFRDRFKGKNLAYLGQINYKKGPMLLLHAFRELVQLDKKYRLFIGGNFQDARYELYFSQMIKEMGLEKNIQIDGWIEDVRTWLEDKHYVVCSSVLEGHPVGLMEAMACGLKPIIHNFVGAKGIYPTKYLWNVIPEFVQKVTHENYDSSEYRRFIETNYSLDIQLRMIDNILNKPKKVKQIPVTGNMIAGTAEKPYNYNDVTAVIAVRNGSTTIKKTLDSLLSQTVPLKKIIVVDDCSNDETPKVVEDYAAKSDGKIELLKLPYNHWVYKARNAAFEKIETEFFFFLDADDFVEPSYTERLLTVLRENPDCAFAYSDMIHFNESQQVQTSLPDFDVTTLMERNYIPYSTLMRYSDFRSLGGYSNYLNDCRNHMTEWDLWLRFVAAGKAGKRYPEPLFYYYQAADQMSKNYERVRSDMHLQMALNRGASCTLNCGNASKTLLVCQGRDYLDRSKVGFEVYTWLKPLAKFGEVFTFFYDVESQYFGQDGMIKRLLSLIDQIQPTYIFHPAYKEHISIDCWKEISKRFVTMVWFSDDNWRFASYSKRYCHGFRFALTTYPEVYGQYKAMDYRTILLSQWAANTEYFRDHGLPKDIDVSFCGQKYGDRSDLLEGSGIQCFGKGWPNGLLDFPEMARVLNRSKISINFSKGADGKLQMKLRPFEIAASNTLLLCEKTDELNKYYKIGKEVIVFENKEDLRQKIDYYLQHEEERKQIARAAYERTIKEHTWSNRFEEIIKAVNGELM